MFRRLVPMSLVLAAAAAAVPTVASAAPSRDRLVLSVTAANGTRTMATLRCNPVGGTHPVAASACAAIASARGDLARLPADEGFCTMQYAPVTAAAVGQWAGKPVRFRQRFGNACELSLRTGAVFALHRSTVS